MNHSQPPSVGTPVFDTVLALLRSAIWGESLFPFQPSAETDWEAVYNESCQQTVQHLPAEILVREDLRRKAMYTNHAARNVLCWLKIMQQHGCQNWKAVKRYPFLKPFARLYQIVWYISRGLRADKPLQLLRNAVRKANTQTNLMEELEAYRMDDES